MQRAIFAMLLVVGLAGPAFANFSDGQRSFAVGDYANAYKTWLPLAQEGDARAQFSIGVLYDGGHGVPVDKDTAADWYQRAADQGYGPAQAALQALTGSTKTTKRQPRKPEKATAKKAPTASSRATGTQAMSEEAQLKAAIENLLADINAKTRQLSFQYGTIDVVRSASGFTYRIDGMVMRDTKGGRADLETITGSIDKKDGERFYVISVILPDVVRGIDSDRQEPFEFRIGAQQSAIVYDRTVKTVTDFDVNWRDVAMGLSDQPSFGTIGEIAIETDLTEREGRWSGPMIFRINGLQSQEPGASKLSVGAFELRMDFDRLDLPGYARLSESAAEGPPPEDLGDRIRDIIGGVSLEISLKSFASAENGSSDARFDGLRWRLALDALDQDYARLAMIYGHDGLSGSVSPQLAPYLPGDVALNIVLDRIPMQTAFKVGVAAGLEMVLFNEVSSAPKLIAELRQAVIGAKTELRIDEGQMSAEAASIALAGGLEADGTAVFGLSGAIGATITGMDRLIAAHDEAVTAKDDETLSSLRFIPVLAQLGTVGADGKTYVYNLEFRPDGQMLINGQSLAPLFAVMFAP